MPRALLVEFTTVDRFHCAVMFPHIKGVARSQGVELPWLRFALRAAVRVGHQDLGVPLSGEDLDALSREVRQRGVNQILFSHQPAAGVLQAAGGSMAAEGDFAFISDYVDSTRRQPLEEEGHTRCQPLGEGDSLAWLGLAEPAGPMPAAVDPDFGWLPGNDLAAEARPLPFLLCGPECLYSRAAANNPAYAGVDLDGCINLRGCAFCHTTRGSSRWGADPLELCRRNLVAVRDTHPPWRGRPRYRLTGEQLISRADELASLVLELGLEPADLLLDSRADRIVRFTDKLDRAAALLEGSGHTLQICLVGLENFSAAELRRMNKGLTPAQLVGAVEELFILEAAHPDSFGIREYGGFSTILYTPWTTLEDLSLNLQMALLLGLEPLCGKLLGSRLRLYPDLPICRLASRDGLLIEAYDDPALDTARRNFYPGEVPWRFAHGEVELINRVTTRLEPDDALADDPLYAQVQGWLAALPGGPTPVGGARLLVSAMRADPGLDTVEALLGAAAEEARGSERPLHLVTGTETMASEEVLLLSEWSPAAAMVQLGRKPVRKEEPFSLTQVEALRREAGEALPNLTFRKRLRTRGGEEMYEMFWGEDAALVQEACQATERLEGLEEEQPEQAALVARIGVLLGYPACCAEAFSRESLTAWERNEWLQLSRRAAIPGPVPPEMNPFQQLFFVPCALDCEAALELVRAIKDEQPGGGRRRWEDEGRQPVLFLLNRPGQYVVLDASQSADGDRLRYGASRSVGDDPRLELVARGDCLELDEGLISVRRSDEVLHTFALEAAVWWAERAFHPNFWRPVAARMLRSRPGGLAGGGLEGRGPVAAGADPMVPYTGERSRWLEEEELCRAVTLAWSACAAGEPPPVQARAFPSSAGARVVRLAVDALPGRQVLSLAGRRLDLGQRRRLVHYSLFHRPAGERPPRWGEVMRLLAVLLDCRARQILGGASQEALSALRAGTALLERVERAAATLSASPRARGFAASWPVQAPDGMLLLTLSDGKRWLDLYLEEPGEPERACFISTGETEVSYFPHCDPDRDGTLGALEEFVRVLRRADAAAPDLTRTAPESPWR